MLRFQVSLSLLHPRTRTCTRHTHISLAAAKFGLVDNSCNITLTFGGTQILHASRITRELKPFFLFLLSTQRCTQCYWSTNTMSSWFGARAEACAYRRHKCSLRKNNWKGCAELSCCLAHVMDINLGEEDHGVLTDLGSSNDCGWQAIGKTCIVEEPMISIVVSMAQSQLER